MYLRLFCLIFMCFFILRPLSYAGFYGEESEVVESNEVQLLHVTSDAIPGEVEIRAVVDADSNLTMIREYLNANEKHDFNLKQLAEGVVLKKSSGHDAIKLLGPTLDPHQGGGIQMVYLTNGITNSYESFPMELAITEGGWSLEVRRHGGYHRITNMFLQGNFFFGQTLGIEGVVVN